jgi:hypothetical protein
MKRHLSALLRRWRSRHGPRRCLAPIGWAVSAETRIPTPILCGRYLGKWTWVRRGTCRLFHRQPGVFDSYDQQGSPR